MDDTISEPVEKGHISRRAVIAGGAVGAAAVWAVPLINSVPAYGAPVTGSTITSACSYFELVYTITNPVTHITTGPFADRVSSTGSCEGNTGSSDVSWCWPCGGVTYDNGGANSGIRNGGLLKLPSSGCTTGDGTFSVHGNTIQPGSGVSILFAIAAAGSLDSTTGQEPGTPGTGGTCETSVGVKKVNVACGPLSSASFSCLPS